MINPILHHNKCVHERHIHQESRTTDEVGTHSEFSRVSDDTPRISTDSALEIYASVFFSCRFASLFVVLRSLPAISHFFLLMTVHCAALCVPILIHTFIHFLMVAHSISSPSPRRTTVILQSFSNGPSSIMRFSPVCDFPCNSISERKHVCPLRAAYVLLSATQRSFLPFDATFRFAMKVPLPCLSGRLNLTLSDWYSASRHTKPFPCRST